MYTDPFHLKSFFFKLNAKIKIVEMSSSDSAEYKNNMRNSSNFPFIPKGGGAINIGYFYITWVLLITT